MKTKEFNIDVSVLNNYTEEQIKTTLKKYTKKELLEFSLNWRALAKQYEANYDELMILTKTK